MTKFLIALVSLVIGWLAGRSLTVGELQGTAPPAESAAANPSYHVPGEGLQVVQEQLDQEKIRVKNLQAQLESSANPPAGDGPLNDIQTLALKRAFEDLQGDVAADKYPGLALSESYQAMKTLLANPEIK